VASSSMLRRGHFRPQGIHLAAVTFRGKHSVPEAGRPLRIIDLYAGEYDGYRPLRGPLAAGERIPENHSPPLAAIAPPLQVSGQSSPNWPNFFRMPVPHRERGGCRSGWLRAI